MSAFTVIGQDINALRAQIAALPGGGGVTNYTHTQLAAAASWTVQHNLGRIRWPVVILDGETAPIIPDALFPDLNTIVLIFPGPAAGKAYV